MTGWLVELKKNLGEDAPLVIHVVGTKSDIVALDPSKRKVPFERTIAYVAEQLYPSQASTPPPTAGVTSISSGSNSGVGTLQSPDSKRSSGFWGQDIGWDCCHEISAKDGEGIDEVFRVITRKLVEERNKKLESESTLRAPTSGGEGGASHSDGSGIDGHGSFRVGNNDKRRSWLGFPPNLVMGDEPTEDEPQGSVKRNRSKCC